MTQETIKVAPCWALHDPPAFLASRRMSDLVTPAKAILSDFLRRSPERPQPDCRFFAELAQTFSLILDASGQAF